MASQEHPDHTYGVIVHNVVAHIVIVAKMVRDSPSSFGVLPEKPLFVIVFEVEVAVTYFLEKASE